MLAITPPDWCDKIVCDTNTKTGAKCNAIQSVYNFIQTRRKFSKISKKKNFLLTILNGIKTYTVFVHIFIFIAYTLQDCPLWGYRNLWIEVHKFDYTNTPNQSTWSSQWYGYTRAHHSRRMGSNILHNSQPSMFVACCI